MRRPLMMPWDRVSGWDTYTKHMGWVSFHFISLHSIFLSSYHITLHLHYITPNAGEGNYSRAFWGDTFPAAHYYFILLHIFFLPPFSLLFSFISQPFSPLFPLSFFIFPQESGGGTRERGKDEAFFFCRIRYDKDRRSDSALNIHPAGWVVSL